MTYIVKLFEKKKFCAKEIGETFHDKYIGNTIARYEHISF